MKRYFSFQIISAIILIGFLFFISKENGLAATLSGKPGTEGGRTSQIGTITSKMVDFDPRVIAGKWNWVSGQQLEIFADGTLKVWLNGSQINTANWECTDKNTRSYTIHHQQGGWVDKVILSGDFNTLTGKNQQGFSLSGTRISGGVVGFDPKVISGKWNWVSGQQLEIFADGTLKVWLNGSQINTASWECTDKNTHSYTFHHQQGGWIDKVILSSDFNTLTGKNQQGSSLSGGRIR
jgi:hypothetical protein